jgi:hypothetical protein
MCSPKVTKFRCLHGVSFQNAQPEKLNAQPEKLNAQPEKLNAQPEKLNAQPEKLPEQLNQNAQPKLQLPVESDLKFKQHELKVQQHELKVQQHELKVQQHELKVQQHELKAQSDEVAEYLLQTLDEYLAPKSGFSKATKQFMKDLDDYVKPTDIFVKPIDKSILYDLCNMICLKKKNYYVIDKNAYRSMMFSNAHLDFIRKLYEYYNPSKQFYLSRELTYNSFTNIIRQICKNNDIKFDSSVRYNKSTSNIDFYIYF